MKKYSKLLIIAFILLLLYLIYDKLFSGLTAYDIRDYVNSFGVLAPIIYIVLFSTLPIAFFPVPILAFAGGISFGLIEGTIYTMIGALTNSLLMFFLARIVARELVIEYLRKRLPKKWFDLFNNSGRKKGLYIIFIMRLIPLVPYNMINYLAGLTEIKLKDYIIATALGILPGTLIFLNIGDKLIDIKSPEFIISIILLGVLIVVSMFFAKRISREDLEKK